MDARWGSVSVGALLWLGTSGFVHGDQAATIRSRLIGNWRLASVESVREGEPSRFNFGKSPRGMITYTADGHMTVHLLDPDRPRTRVADARPDELRALATTYTAYFGTFDVDEAAAKVTHHRDGSNGPGERDFVRAVEFAGNRLILTTPTTEVEGRKQFSRITWERLGAADAAAAFDAAARAAVVGTWRLVSHQTTLADGTVRRNYGDSPQGLFVFSADGHATVQITNATRPSTPFAKASDEELRELMRSYLAYFGTYDVNPVEHYLIVHTVADLNSVNTGADQKRFFEIQGSRMILMPPPTETSGGKVVSRITWERVR